MMNSEAFLPWPKDLNESLDNITFYLYLQQAYKEHSAIPTVIELRERNPHYKEMRKLEKMEKQKGISRYKLNAK